MASASEIQAMTPELLTKAVHVFELEDSRRGRSWGRQSWSRDNQPEMLIPIYAEAAGTASITIAAADGPSLNTISADLKKGLNYVSYNYTYTKDAWAKYKQFLTDKLEKDDSLPDLEPADDGRYYLQAGSYKVTVKKENTSSEGVFELK